MKTKTKSRNPWSSYPSKKRRGGEIWTAGFVGNRFETLHAFRPEDGQIVATFHRVTPSGLVTGYRENAAAFVDTMNERLTCLSNTNGASVKSKPKATAPLRPTPSVRRSIQEM